MKETHIYIILFLVGLLLIFVGYLMNSNTEETKTCIKLCKTIDMSFVQSVMRGNDLYCQCTDGVTEPVMIKYENELD